MWILLTELDIKPYEIELIPIEDLNVIWCMYEYSLERKKHDAFKAEGKSNK